MFAEEGVGGEPTMTCLHTRSPQSTGWPNLLPSHQLCEGSWGVQGNRSPVIMQILSSLFPSMQEGTSTYPDQRARWVTCFMGLLIPERISLILLFPIVS